MDKDDVRLIRSKNSKVIHTPGCPWVRAMKKENRRFLREREREDGLKPCKQCNAESGQTVYH